MHPAKGGMLFLFYFVPMMKPFYVTTLLLIFLCLNLSAQKNAVPYAKNAIKANRVKDYHNLVNNSINRNLSLPLTDSTEENWQDAFNAMELINYRSAAVDAKVRSAFKALEKRSTEFQRAFLELIYTNYSKEFVPQVVLFLKKINNTKLFAMCAEYLFMNNQKEKYRKLLMQRMNEIVAATADEKNNPFFTVLQNNLKQHNLINPPLKDFLKKNFLEHEIILYSFQRKNRNYPGLVMVRGKDGDFVKETNGNYFAVPQLARSITNMPGYLTNGNTPQGIFKMFGFGNSKSSFIGPTTNIQMVMPFEKSEDQPDSVTQFFGKAYASLVPDSWKKYYPIYESYYAGLAGRTEIIAHGTTVNPEYYKAQPYYPLTPTAGCLCTKEIWSTVDGKRMESDQQKLVNALMAAGGAIGYCIVIEIDDKQKTVLLNEILPFLKQR